MLSHTGQSDSFERVFVWRRVVRWRSGSRACCQCANAASAPAGLWEDLMIWKKILGVFALFCLFVLNVIF